MDVTRLSSLPWCNKATCLPTRRSMGEGSWTGPVRWLGPFGQGIPRSQMPGHVCKVGWGVLGTAFPGPYRFLLPGAGSGLEKGKNRSFKAPRARSAFAWSETGIAHERLGCWSPGLRIQSRGALISQRWQERSPLTAAGPLPLQGRLGQSKKPSASKVLTFLSPLQFM